MITSIETGRKEDGNRSIADKIIKRLHDLEKTSKYNKGRWAWELLQNAKDSVDENFKQQIKIKIEYGSDFVKFSHNGLYFTELDLRGLINVITSKEVEEGMPRRKTGKFGTGFLTTHLLSKNVEVSGVLKTVNDTFFEFSFPIDRDAQTTTLLAPKIEETWAQFHASTKQIFNYQPGELNTSFKYPLNSETQVQIAETGLNEFVKLIPFVLIFNPTIQQIEIVYRETPEKNLRFANGGQLTDIVKRIECAEPTCVKEFFILTLNDVENKTQIAKQVEVIDDQIQIVGSTEIPKLFCDFPLIGTEEFYFPVIINSFFLNPLTERNGIWLDGDDDKEVQENRRVLQFALNLYKNLIETVSKDTRFKKLYNLATTILPKANEENFDKNWYIANIQKPLRQFLFKQTIIELPNSLRNSFEVVRIPKKGLNKKDSETVWDFYFDLEPEKICKKEDIFEWQTQTWDECIHLEIQRIVNNIQEKGSIGNLMVALKKDEPDTIAWLNRFYNFVTEEESNLILFDKHKLIPNRKGTFREKLHLRIDQIKDEELVSILRTLGYDWDDLLLLSGSAVGTSLRFDVKTQKLIADEITLILEKRSVRDEVFVSAIRMLAEWFEYNSNLGKELFSNLYRKRAELFMNTIDDKDSLYRLMRTKTSLSTLSKVAEMIDKNPKLAEKLNDPNFNAENNAVVLYIRSEEEEKEENKYKVVLEWLISELQKRGIANITELLTLLDDVANGKLIYRADLGSSSTLPSEKGEIFEQILAEALHRAITHLKAKGYEFIGEVNINCPTVFNVTYQGEQFKVVIRPAQGGKYKMFYPLEYEVLQAKRNELWLADKMNAWEETLGGLVSRIFAAGSGFIPTTGFIPGRLK